MASPNHVFFDSSEAVTLGDGGLTSIQVRLDREGPLIYLCRAVGSRVDLFATTTEQSAFSLGVRVLLVKDLGPLSVALSGWSGELDLISGLRLGPVDVNWGRSIGSHARRWSTVTVAPGQRFEVLLGLESIPGGRISAVAGIRLFPKSRLYGASLLIRDGSLSLTVGGTF
jgi:hypothetical protein